MLGGVAFFSYIMENFMEIINNYNEKMGFTEHSEELNEWVVSLERFTNKQPLTPSLVDALIKDFNYYWAHDRVECLQ